MKRFRRDWRTIVTLSALLGTSAYGAPVSTEFGPEGLSFRSPSENFAMNLRFRMQNRATYEVYSDHERNIEAIPRRLRLRFDGFAVDPRLTYRVQLAFSRGDQDWDNTGVPNVVRDAMLIWRWTPQFQIGFGQTKLPGNRQRVISSGEQQFVDRSIVNAAYTPDRDVGLQIYYSNDFLGVPLNLRAALTHGEGRNGGVAPAGNAGMSYTARAEILPQGKFKEGGDYFEGDLLYEESLRTSLGLVYSTNQRAVRTGGQIGQQLFDSRTIDTGYLDFVAKFRGFSLYTEYAIRGTSGSPITSNGTQERFVRVGTGALFQMGYFFTEQWEAGARYAVTSPRASIHRLANEELQYTAVLSRYIHRHRIKVQTDLTYANETAFHASREDRHGWIWRFQVELGI